MHDASTRASIIDSLKAVFGADKIKGDIAVDANAGPAPWLVDLRTALEHLKAPGVQAVFDGNSLRVGGLIGETDRDRIIGSLRSALGPGLAFGSLTDKVGDLVTSVTTKAEAALAALRPGFSTNDLLSILNQSIINFPTGGTEIPPISRALLQNAAASMKQLPSGTVIEIGGHTDNTGDAAANMMLSQQRAEAVRAELVQDGVDPGMLVVKGYGSAKPLAGNDTVEGRFANRRIEYRVRRGVDRVESSNGRDQRDTVRRPHPRARRRAPEQRQRRKLRAPGRRSGGSSAREPNQDWIIRGGCHDIDYL